MEEGIPLRHRIELGWIEQVNEDLVRVLVTCNQLKLSQNMAGINPEKKIITAFTTNYAVLWKTPKKQLMHEQNLHY